MSYVGQFDDAEDDMVQEHLMAARAASQAAATAGGEAPPRPMGPPSRGLGFAGAGSEAAYLAMLGGNSGSDAAAAAASPYGAYQRPAYRPYGMPGQPGAGYGGMGSPAENMYGARPGAAMYGRYPPAASPADQQRYAAAAAAYGRDLHHYYGHSNQGMLEQAYGAHGNPAPRADSESENMKSSPAASMSAYRKMAQTPQSVAAPSPLQEQQPGSPKTPASSKVHASPTSAMKTPRPEGKESSNNVSTVSRSAGPGGGGVRSTGGSQSSPNSAAKIAPILPAKLTKGGETGEDGQRYYNGCVPLGLPEDKYWLSELQVYLRSNFAEAFGATEADIAAPMHGRNKPIALGQVGIRCMHCRNDPPSERGQQATSYPSLISGIYNSVQQMLRLHFDCCLSMPADVRAKIEQLKVSSSARGGRKQYWIDSAKRLGLIDTPHGIHFGRDPYGPLPPLSGPSAEDEARLKVKHDIKTKNLSKAAVDALVDPSTEGNGLDGEDDEAQILVQEVEPYPLVEPDDKDLISDYLYLTLEQMAPCNLMEADKVGCYKGREVGFPGLACKHCVGQAGCGRYFPASEASLSQTTTSQTIMNHVRNCRRCPIEIRENLELMKRARMGPDGKRADKPKHGGRKVFFHRLWCRIQRIPIEAEKGNKKKRKKASETPRRGRKKRIVVPSPSDLSLSDDEAPVAMSSSEDEKTETEDENSSDDEVKVKSAKKKKGGRVAKAKKVVDHWHAGCVRLTKLDDPHWLSEIQCYVRSDMVEVFSHNKKESLVGYDGRKQPGIGQVGVRCVFCKNLHEDERPQNCIYFPEELGGIQKNVNDLIRLHFPSCPAIPDDVKANFRSMKGFGAKADGDSGEYWVDSARDIGLMDIPAQSAVNNGWGISFRRDPLQPSPADELDREKEGVASFHYGKSSLVRNGDMDSCTDHAMLLLRQVKPCQFKKTDRRGASSGRGRDRVIGYPGLACKHCSSKSNYGRYFPISAKNLTDNTANSMQSHISSCARCPENIKASLAYLVHRSTVQKPNLSGSWKKSFYKQVWDRLHERNWTNGEGDEADSDSSSDGDEAESPEKGDDANGEQESDEEHVGENMSKLIKAAAIWLTEQDTVEGPSRTRNGGGRGRTLPSRGRSLPVAAMPSSSSSSGGSKIRPKRRAAV